MAFSKNQQTAHQHGSTESDITVARLLLAGYTNAQLALALSLRPDDVARILALPTPT